MFKTIVDAFEELCDASEKIKIRAAAQTVLQSHFWMRSLKIILKNKRHELEKEALQFAKDACEKMGLPVVKKNCQEEEN
ncbi:hypothetical protein CDAR_3131 [Caerostris darwini]|uniref:Uncharacterized protein n=1 Tax=Caerostris darwini TaxID=1538125 RepID=A0AAV4UV71_9ARAC|nr:hypothetical protein CDAR_3131 [Caerostris darwini]